MTTLHQCVKLHYCTSLSVLWIYWPRRYIICHISTRETVIAEFSIATISFQIWPHNWAEKPQCLFHNALKKGPSSLPAVLPPVKLFQKAFSPFAYSMYTLEGDRILSLSPYWLLDNYCLPGCVMTFCLQNMNHQGASSYGCYPSNMNTCTSQILCNQFNVSPTPVHKWKIQFRPFGLFLTHLSDSFEF